MEGIKVDAIDYLLKNYTSFLKAVNKT